MKFSEFRLLVKNYPLFRSNSFEHITNNVPLLRRQITEWVAKGYILALKRGIYTLAEAKCSNYFLANQIYTPSYISLESALSYYGLIPEAVYATTSVTTKKTAHFENYYGRFSYHHCKISLYGDYIEIKDEFGYTVKMASKERAIIDFLYFKTPKLAQTHTDIFDLSLRWQNLSDIDANKLILYAKKFEQKKLTALIELFIKRQQHEN